MELSNEFRRKKYSTGDVTLPIETANTKNDISDKPHNTDSTNNTDSIDSIDNTNNTDNIYKVAYGDEDTRKWIATESAVSFNFSKLVKKIKNHIKKVLPKASPEEVSEKIGENLKIFTINNQYFEYSNIPNELGGVRWFVLCPRCKKNSLKLFLPKVIDRDQLYLCKACHKLKPYSMLLGNRKKYKEITRPLKRLEYIKKKLLKKNLSIDEAENLMEEYEEIEKKLGNSKEYRLWKFKREHGKL